jgi:hypothetical protein
MTGVGFRIESLHAFVAIHSDGDEGVIGILTPSGWLPAVAADKKRLDELRPQVEAAAKVSPYPIKLVRFDQRTDLEEIKP